MKLLKRLYNNEIDLLPFTIAAMGVGIGVIMIALVLMHKGVF